MCWARTAFNPDAVNGRKRRKAEKPNHTVEFELVAGGKKAQGRDAEGALSDGENVPAALFALMHAEVEEELKRGLDDVCCVTGWNKMEPRISKGVGPSPWSQYTIGGGAESTFF